MNLDRYRKSILRNFGHRSKEQLCQTSKLCTLWVSQECTFYTNIVYMAILKFQFACNNSVNLNFDTRYLGNARSDLHAVFCYLFVVWSAFRIYQTWKLYVHPYPSGLVGLYPITSLYFSICSVWIFLQYIASKLIILYSY